MILKSTGCTFKFPLTYPDEIVVFVGKLKGRGGKEKKGKEKREKKNKKERKEEEIIF